MKHLVTVLVLMGLALTYADSAQAMPFDLPPEFNAPEWYTSFPYQRNILWTFDKDPTGNPPHYEGYDDPYLWTSDYVYFEGAVEHIPGYIGIDNSDGVDPVEGHAVFHIDNWPILRPTKNIWIEIETLEPMPWEDHVMMCYPELPPEYSTVDFEGYVYTDDVNPEVFYTWWLKIQPNPPWEEICLYIWADPGQVVLVDSIHVATECIPAPGAILLGSIGVGLVGWLRRRKTL